MKSKELFQKIRRGDIANCYFFSGEEEYLREKAISLIRERLIPEGMEDLNYQLSYASDSVIEMVMDLVETLPFLIEKRLVVLKEVERLSAADFKRICEYLNSPNPNTCFILVSTGKVNQKRGYYKKIAECLEWVDFWPLFENEIPEWIVKEMGRRGKSISGFAAQLLQAEVGNNLFNLSSEIDKLEIFVGARKIIGEEDIMSLVGRRRGDTVFDLLDAMDKKSTSLALEIVSHLFEEGKDPIQILTIICTRYRQFLMGRILMEKGYSAPNILNKMQLNPYFNRNFTRYLENLSLWYLSNVFRLLFKADIKIKTGKMPPRLVLELLILDLCGVHSSV